jgi:hypothetical protein
MVNVFTEIPKEEEGENENGKISGSIWYS